MLAHCGLFIVQILGLDGDAQLVGLAVNSGDLHLHLVVHAQRSPGVVHPLLGDLGGFQHRLHILGKLDDRLLGIHRLHPAGDNLALLVLGDELLHRLGVKLLQAEGDALPVGVNGHDDRLDLVPLGEAPHRHIAGLVEGDVGQVHQAVNAAGQRDEDAEVRDGLDPAGDALAPPVLLAERLPGVGDALLDAQGDAPALLVDVQHHHLYVVPHLHHLAGVDVAVGPIHLGDMHQALHALLDLGEAAVVREVGDLGHGAGVHRIPLGDGDPGVLAQLLQAQGHPAALLVELQHLHL